MHYVIRALVYADTPEEALQTAKDDVFERLVHPENNSGFDYYTTFEHEGSCVSGKGRWGDLPAVMRADSKEGKRYIKEGWKYMCREQKYHMNKIRKWFKKGGTLHDFRSGDEKRTNGNMLKYHFNRLGSYSGDTYLLYDNDGEAIDTKRHLKNVLERWDCLYGDKTDYVRNPYDAYDHIFVVLADIHS
jgi:hypothetical protein